MVILRKDGADRKGMEGDGRGWKGGRVERDGGVATWRVGIYWSKEMHF